MHAAVPERAPRRRSGFTLLEMLVVIAIAAILTTMTVLSMAGMARRASREGAVEEVINILRQARISAVDTGRGSLVRLNPAQNNLYGIATTIEAAWHFEQIRTDNTTPGARNMPGRPMDDDLDLDDDPNSNPPTIAPGAVGLCLEFDHNLGQFVDCGNFPVYDQTDGIRIEAYVRPEGATSVDQILPVIAKYAYDYAPSDAAGYALGLICTDAGGAGRYAPFARLYIAGGGGMAQMIDLGTYDTTNGTGTTWAGGQWHHLALEFDGFEARLFVDGIMVDLDSYQLGETGDPYVPTDVQFNPGSRIRRPRDWPLQVGRFVHDADEDPLDLTHELVPHYFTGRIDEPMLLSLAGGQRVNLPDQVAMAASEQVVHLDSQGQLDLTYHAGPVYVALGDPYQSATLASDMDDDPLTNFLILRERSPFPPDGGLLMIETIETGQPPYEVISYTTASDTAVFGVDRQAFWTPTVKHYVGDRVLFARVARIDHNGLVSRQQ